jgi:hypothetical protein
VCFDCLFFSLILRIAGGSVSASRRASNGAHSSSSSAPGGSPRGSNVTSSLHVAKKSKTAQSKDDPTSSSPAKTRQTQNAGSDHPTPGTLTKAQMEFNIKVGMKDPLPEILSEMTVPPMPSRIVHRRSNRITEIENAKSANSTSPMSTKKTPINRAAVEQDQDQDSPTQPQIKMEGNDKEEEGLEGTDDDAATDDDATWKPQTNRAIRAMKEERLVQDTRHNSEQLQCYSVAENQLISINTANEILCSLAVVPLAAESLWNPTAMKDRHSKKNNYTNSSTTRSSELLLVPEGTVRGEGRGGRGRGP